MKDLARITNRSHRSETKSRRAARVRVGLVLACALGVLLAGVAVFHEVLPLRPASGGVVVAVPAIDDPDITGPEEEDPNGGGPPPPGGTDIPDAQPGAPRPWEMSLRASPYSTVNLLNRNVLTVLPIVSWTGIGPAMEMNLYHNSSSVVLCHSLLLPSLEQPCSRRSAIIATTRSRCRDRLEAMIVSSPILRMVPRIALTWPWGMDRSMANAWSQETSFSPRRVRLMASMASGGRQVRLARVRLRTLLPSR